MRRMNEVQAFAHSFKLRVYFVALCSHLNQLTNFICLRNESLKSVSNAIREFALVIHVSKTNIENIMSLRCISHFAKLRNGIDFNAMQLQKPEIFIAKVLFDSLTFSTWRRDARIATTEKKRRRFLANNQSVHLLANLTCTYFSHIISTKSPSFENMVLYAARV